MDRAIVHIFLLTLLLLMPSIGAHAASRTFVDHTRVNQSRDLAENQRAEPKLVVGNLSNLGSSWQTVSLPYEYDEMVVVATPAYTDALPPAVVRIRNTEGNSFEIRVQNPSGLFLLGYSAQYVVMEAGVYDEDEFGVAIEAGVVTSTITDHSLSWTGEETELEHDFEQPVVLGQVMSYNDERWSVFWSKGGAQGQPPSSEALFTGKHVGEDQTATRNNESIGYIVFEAGFGSVDGYSFQAIIGDDIVQSVTDAAPYVYTHSLSGNGYAVASQAAMDGFNGSWAVLWGTDSVAEGTLSVAVDEDQLQDEERIHSTEQLHVVVFDIALAPPQLLSFSPDAGIPGDEVTLYGNNFTAIQEVLFNGIQAEYTPVSDQEMNVVVPEGATTGNIEVRTAGGAATSATPFLIVNVPQIFSFFPEEGPRGTVVEITGQNFVEVADVSFGGWSSQSYQIVSETKIIATVPSSSDTGRIRVRNIAGMATTPEAFRVIPSTAFDSLVPSRASALSTISITGAGFLDAQAVQFPGGIEAEFVVLSDEEIQVVVPSNSLSGPVNVVFEDGTILQGPVDFTLTFSEPFQGLNLCRLTSASVAQSSTGATFAQASKACDGITEGTFDGQSYTDTESEWQPWWEVDLGASYNISEVAVWNRVDCCQDNLEDFYVLISDSPFASESLSETLADQDVRASYFSEVTVFESIDINDTGRYIRVQRQGVGVLSMAEVEIVSGAGNATNTENELASETHLEKAYPSPFQSHTTIPYRTGTADHVYLSVFDVLGREVRVLEDVFKPAGTHQSVFEAGDLPNGVYYYRLLIGSKVMTQSVVLAK